MPPSILVRRWCRKCCEGCRSVGVGLGGMEWGVRRSAVLRLERATKEARHLIGGDACEGGFNSAVAVVVALDDGEDALDGVEDGAVRRAQTWRRIRPALHTEAAGQGRLLLRCSPVGTPSFGVKDRSITVQRFI